MIEIAWTDFFFYIRLFHTTKFGFDLMCPSSIFDQMSCVGQVTLDIVIGVQQDDKVAWVIWSTNIHSKDKGGRGGGSNILKFQTVSSILKHVIL